MSTAHHSVSIHFARTLIATAKRNGLDHLPLLRAAGLNEKVLENLNLRITPDQLSRLMQEIWQQSDDEFMYMGSHPSRHGVFTLMAKQAVHCHNLHAVLRHIAHFYNLVTEAVSFEIKESREEIHFCIRLNKPDKDPDYTLREFLLLLWHRFPGWLIGQRIPLKHVSVDFPKPAHCAEYPLMYPCSVIYDQPECSLTFDRAMLAEPVIQTPRTLSAYLQRAPLDWFKRQAYFQAYTRRVMDLLESEQERGLSSMDLIAQKLHLTSRTLHRKLAEEGTTFQKLKDDIRRDEAIHFLSQRSLTIAEISRQLGFSEPTAFTRAFRKWTGINPSFYRNQSVKAE